MNKNLDKMITSAQDLIYEHDYHSMSVAMLAHAMGISKACLYHYLNSKSELPFLILNTVEKSKTPTIKENIVLLKLLMSVGREEKFADLSVRITHLFDKNGVNIKNVINSYLTN